MAEGDRDMEGIRGMKGYYRRPSRAIEKGGGFFVPGLEGERIRVLAAAALLLMVASNRVGVQVAPPSLVTSELIGIATAVVLFMQGVVSAFPEGPAPSAAGAGDTAASFLSVLQSSSPSSSGAVLETAARSVVQTCEDVCYVLVVAADGTIALELGPVSGRATPADVGRALAAAAAATTTASKSTGNKAGATAEVRLVAATTDPTAAFVASAGVKVPSAAESVAVVTNGATGLTWVVAAAAPPESLRAARDWIAALASTPV